MKTILTSIVMGGFGALAVTVSPGLEWPTWVMFIAWVSYYLFGRSMTKSVMPFVQIVSGIGLGLLIQISAQGLSNYLEAKALPVSVFIFIGSLAFISKHTKLNNIPAWFVGLIIFFGVHPPVEFVPMVSLLLPTTAGFLFAWLNDTVLHKVNEIKPVG